MEVDTQTSSLCWKDELVFPDSPKTFIVPAKFRTVKHRTKVGKLTRVFVTCTKQAFLFLRNSQSRPEDSPQTLKNKTRTAEFINLLKNSPELDFDKEQKQ